MNNTTKAHLALLGANIFYGAGFSVAKYIMPRLIQPNGFILIRVGCAMLLFALSYFLGKNFRTIFDKKDYPRLIACAIFGVACNQLLFFKGLELTSPIHASLMMLSTPILVSIFAAYLLKEKFTSQKYLGLALGIIGSLILVSQAAKNNLAPDPILGNLFILLNAASYAIYLVIVKPLMQKYRPIIIIRFLFFIGFWIVLPFGFHDLQQINWQEFLPQEIAAVVFIVVGITFFTYLWNIYALKILSPSTAGAYIYSQPVFSAFIAILFLGEHITLEKLIAAILIFLCVYLVSKKTKTNENKLL